MIIKLLSAVDKNTHTQSMVQSMFYSCSVINSTLWPRLHLPSEAFIHRTLSGYVYEIKHTFYLEKYISPISTLFLVKQYAKWINHTMNIQYIDKLTKFDIVLGFICFSVVSTYFIFEHMQNTKSCIIQTSQRNAECLHVMNCSCLSPIDLLPLLFWSHCRFTQIAHHSLLKTAMASPKTTKTIQHNTCSLKS